MSIKRTVYTDIQGIAFGPISQQAPDVVVRMVDPELGEIDTDEVKALAIQCEEGKLLFICTEEIRRNLLEILSGGIEIVPATGLKAALENGGI